MMHPFRGLLRITALPEANKWSIIVPCFWPEKRALLISTPVNTGDMFLIPPSPDTPEEAVGLDESAESLTILLKILHDPPNPPTEITTDPYQRQWDPSTVIPLPLLELVILKLADKYILDEWIVKNLDNHLLAHASTHGLRVYGIALSHFRKEIAILASPHVQTMARYTREEVKCLPTVEAYHDLVRFQDFRVKALRDLVLNEDIFPHGEFPLFASCAHISTWLDANHIV